MDKPSLFSQYALYFRFIHFKYQRQFGKVNTIGV